MKCKRRKCVRVRGKSGRGGRCKTGYALRCSSYGRGKASARGRSGYRRGKRPYNKNKKCKVMGVNRRGNPVCKSYGSTSGWRAKGGRARKYPSASMFSKRMPSYSGGGIPMSMHWLGR